MSSPQALPAEPTVAPRDEPVPSIPRPPETLAETGLSEEAVIELLLKIFYVQGAQTGREVADAVHLPFHIVDDLLLALQQRRIAEVLRTEGHGRAAYVYDLTGSGRERARDALEASKYVGPAPVSLEDYKDWIMHQSVRSVRIGRDRVREGFSDLVLTEETLESLGPAVNSARSLFLHGEPGNGKTAIAERIAAMVGGSVFVPYAVDIDGETMLVYDPVHHRKVDEDEPGEVGGSRFLRAEPPWDQRYARVHRPTVFVGGELTLDQLDLQYDSFAKFYQAPFQLKASGGVLIIDDFGRQRMRAGDLLNRWIVPLEKEVDFLSLHTGVKFPVPFDTLLIFATNLDPADLVDEAFLRRINFKLKIEGPDRENFERIFRDVCSAQEIEFDGAAVERIYERFYDRFGIHPRGCHPRDLIQHVQAVARYEGVPVALSQNFIDRACRSYFVVMNQAALERGYTMRGSDAAPQTGTRGASDGAEGSQ